MRNGKLTKHKNFSHMRRAKLIYGFSHTVTKIEIKIVHYIRVQISLYSAMF